MLAIDGRPGVSPTVTGLEEPAIFVRRAGWPSAGAERCLLASATVAMRCAWLSIGATRPCYCSDRQRSRQSRALNENSSSVNRRNGRLASSMPLAPALYAYFTHAHTSRRHQPSEIIARCRPSGRHCRRPQWKITRQALLQRIHRRWANVVRRLLSTGRHILQ